MKLKYIPQAPEMFVALGLCYQETKVIQAVEDKNYKDQLYGACLDDLISGKPRQLVKKPLEEFPGPYFPVFSKYREPRKELKAHYALYQTIARRIEDFYLRSLSIRQRSKWLKLICQVSFLWKRYRPF